MSKRTVKRRYHSEVRAAAAVGTRAAITAAARRLFASRGYTATPIDRIAREAGVAVPTVYAAFGTKGAILESVLDTMEHEADVGALTNAMRALPSPGSAMRSRSSSRSSSRPART